MNVDLGESLLNKRILVIGGGGFIGRHVVSALSTAGAEVCVLDFVSPHAGLGGVEWVIGSISDGTLVASVSAGCDGVIFLANASLPGSSQGSFEREAVDHVGATIRVAEICQDVGVDTFLFASSGGTVYGYNSPVGGIEEDVQTKPLNGYGVSKLAIEHYLRLIGSRGNMRCLSLRISNPYGEGQRALRAQGVVAAAMQHAVNKTKMVIWGDGTIERDFIHVEDVATAFVAGLSYSGNLTSFNIGTGVSKTINEIIEATRTHTGFDLRVEYQKNRSIDVVRNVLCIKRANQELNWKPSIEFDHGIERTAAWWCRKG